MVGWPLVVKMCSSNKNSIKLYCSVHSADDTDLTLLELDSWGVVRRGGICQGNGNHALKYNRCLHQQNLCGVSIL